MKLTHSYGDTREVNNSQNTISHHILPATLSVAFFIETPPPNIIPAQICISGGLYAFVFTSLSAQPNLLPPPPHHKGFLFFFSINLLSLSAAV